MPDRSHNIVLRGAKGGGGSSQPKQFTEAKNTLFSNTTARLVDALGAGEIRGLVNGAKSIYLDNTPVQAQDGSANFQGITWEFRPGTETQDYLKGFSEIETYVGVGVEVKYGAPVTRSIVDQELDAIRVTVQIPGLVATSSDQSSMTGTSVQYAFDIATDGGPYVRKLTNTVNGKTTSSYEVSHRLDLPAGTRWDIRMTRLTADSTKSTLQNGTNWASYTRIIEAKMIYPGVALIGYTVDASEFGNSLPARQVEIYGRLIQIPSNYNPETRTYTGIWDGTFKTAYSNNPAWVLYDLLTDPLDGQGRIFTPDRVDKWGLYAIAQYCDELVPDGYEGMEPRFTFNGLINEQKDAMSVITAVAGMMRVIVFVAAGMVYFSQDRPMQPTRLFTPANVVNGEFNYEGTGMSARHSVAYVSWLDPDDSYNTAIEVVEDAEMIERFGWRPADEIALGCTSRGQAWRHGAMLLDTEHYSNETVTFTVGLDGAGVMPGEVVAIADPFRAGARTGGRLLEVDEAFAKMDAAFAFDPAESYTLWLTKPDGKAMLDVAIINPGLETDTLEFVAPLKIMPVEGALFIISASNVAPRQFRVISIAENEGYQFTFTGLLYDPTKYDRVEKDIHLQPLPTSLFPTGDIAAPTNLATVEYLFLQSGLTPAANILFSWSSNDPRAIGFQVEIALNGGSFTRTGTVSGLSTEIPSEDEANVTMRVRAMDSLGRFSQWTEIQFMAQALYVPPSNVTGFQGEAHSDLFLLTWNPVPDIHLDHYEIRYASDAAGLPTWDEAQVIASNVSKSSTSYTVGLQAGYYFIKAVTVKNVFSPIAAMVMNQVTVEYLSQNIVESTVQDPDWPGFRQLVEPDGTDGLILRQDYDGLYYNRGYYYFAPLYYDLGAVYDAWIVSELQFHFSMLDETGDGANQRAWLEYSSTNEDPHETESIDVYAPPDIYDLPDVYEAEGIWSDWIPFSQPFQAQARVFRFRLVLESDDRITTPVVTVARLVLDMPDRRESGSGVEVPATADGVYVTYRAPFKHSVTRPNPAVVLTQQDSQEGDRLVLTEETASGFRVQIRNNDQPVSGSFNWMATGYGELKTNIRTQP